MTGSYDVNGYIGYQAVATSIVFVGIAGAFVAARLVVRLGIIHNAGPDDWVILASVVSLVPSETHSSPGLIIFEACATSPHI